jgi:hypothetical protein
MTREQLEGVVRHILTTIGGVLVTKGTISESIVEIAVGVGVGLVGLVWSLINKNK